MEDLRIDSVWNAQKLHLAYEGNHLHHHTLGLPIVWVWHGPTRVWHGLAYAVTVQRPRPKPLESNKGQLRSAHTVHVGWIALGLCSTHEGSSTGYQRNTYEIGTQLMLLLASATNESVKSETYPFKVCYVFIIQPILCTRNRKTLTCFVRTKPRSSVVITKPLASRMSLRACKASWLYYVTLYYKIMLVESLCFTEGTVYLYYSLWKNKWNTT